MLLLPRGGDCANMSSFLGFKRSRHTYLDCLYSSPASPKCRSVDAYFTSGGAALVGRR